MNQIATRFENDDYRLIAGELVSENANYGSAYKKLGEALRKADLENSRKMGVGHNRLFEEMLTKAKAKRDRQELGIIGREMASGKYGGFVSAHGAALLEFLEDTSDAGLAHAKLMREGFEKEFAGFLENAKG